MKKTFVAFFTAVAVWALGASNASSQELVIIHYNDTHSHIEPERSGKNAGQGGVVERAALIDSVYKASGKKNVLLLHGGDFNQGTTYFTELGGQIEVELHNALGYDATALGNHEFDNGLDDLAARVKRLKADVLCANYDFSKFTLGKYVKPYTIVKKAGLKIGIVGLLTDVSSVVAHDIAKNLHYLDPAVVVNAYAEYLTDKKKCDMIIVLSHLGFGEDMDLASKIKGVDLIIGGHSHTTLKDIRYIEDLDHKKVPIVQNGCWGLESGIIHVNKK